MECLFFCIQVSESFICFTRKRNCFYRISRLVVYCLRLLWERRFQTCNHRLFSRSLQTKMWVIIKNFTCVGRDKMAAILQIIFWNSFSITKFDILFIEISLKFVSMSPNNNRHALVQIMNRRKLFIWTNVDLFTDAYVTSPSLHELNCIYNIEWVVFNHGYFLLKFGKSQSYFNMITLLSKEA